MVHRTGSERRKEEELALLSRALVLASDGERRDPLGQGVRQAEYASTESQRGSCSDG